MQELHFDTQLAHLAVPQSIQGDPAYTALIGLVRSRGFCRTSSLRKLLATFISLKDRCILLNCFVESLAAHVYDPTG